MVSHSLTNQDISDILSISVETVKEHVANILRKAGFASRTQIALWAVDNWKKLSP